jgi:hypothetical protein
METACTFARSLATCRASSHRARVGLGGWLSMRLACRAAQNERFVLGRILILPNMWAGAEIPRVERLRDGPSPARSR